MYCSKSQNAYNYSLIAFSPKVYLFQIHNTQAHQPRYSFSPTLYRPKRRISLHPYVYFLYIEFHAENTLRYIHLNFLDSPSCKNLHGARLHIRTQNCRFYYINSDCSYHHSFDTFSSIRFLLMKNSDLIQSTHKSVCFCYQNMYI